MPVRWIAKPRNQNLTIEPCKRPISFFSTARFAGLMTAIIKAGCPKRELTEILARKKVLSSLCPPCGHNN